MSTLSLSASQRHNSVPTALTTSDNTSQIPTLENIRDHLSIVKHLAHTLSPRNAHSNLNAVYLGLDDASSKLITFQDGLKRTCSAAVYDSDTPVAFYTVSDTLLDVLRKVELAPERIAFESKTRRPLKEIWRNLKQFGPIIGERQRQLRRLYISTLNVVTKVLTLSFFLPYVLEEAGLIENDWIFQVKRCVLTRGFTQSFGADPLKSNASCDIGLPLPLLISYSSQIPTRTDQGHSRQAEIRKRSDALDKAHAEALRWGRINGRGWGSDGQMIQQAIPTLTKFEQTVQAIREVLVESKEISSEDDEDEPCTEHFKPVDYNQPPASHSKTSSRMESHAPSCSHPVERDYFSFKLETARPILVPMPTHAESKPPAKSTAKNIPTKAESTQTEFPRFDSPVASILAPDLSETHFQTHGLKRYTDAEHQKELKKDSGAGFESDEEEESCHAGVGKTSLVMPLPQPMRKAVGGYFDL